MSEGWSDEWSCGPREPSTVSNSVRTIVNNIRSSWTYLLGLGLVRGRVPFLRLLCVMWYRSLAAPDLHCLAGSSICLRFGRHDRGSHVDEGV